MLRIPFVLLRNILALLHYAWAMFWYKLGYFVRRKKKLYLTLDLQSDYEFGPRPGLAGYFQETPSFLEMREAFRRVGRSEDIDGVVLTTNGLNQGMASTAALTSVIDRARERDLHVVAHSRMALLSEYVLMTAADDIMISPAGRLYTFGPRFDQIFAADALSKIGVTPQMIHIGEFKTASHRMIHSEMTEPQRLMMESLHEGMLELLINRVALRRGIPPVKAEKLFASAPTDATDARQLGLIDHGLFRGRIGEWLRHGDDISTSAVLSEAERAEEIFQEATGQSGQAGGQAVKKPETRSSTGGMEPPATDEEATPEERSPVPHEDPEGGEDVLMLNFEDASGALRPHFDWMPLLRPAPRMAVLDLSGMIVMPDMGMPSRGPVIDPDTVLPALRRVRDTAHFAGLLLHINSPGGSALASDIIWEAIQRVRREIPVVAYCTDVVGSGGYYLASAADEIVCHRTTIAGSIGVVTGKMSAEGLPQKFGVNIESIYKHDADTFTSLVHPLSEKMLDRMNEDARAFYRRFLQRVGQARDIPRERLHRYARGRVYLGEGAARRGLIDEIGDFDIAFDRLCSLCRLDPRQTDIDFVPHRQQGLQQMLRGGLQTIAPAVADRLFEGEFASMPDELVEPLMAAKMLQHENALALMPLKLETGREELP